MLSLALEHCFDPVRDMLDTAEANWDGTQRLDRMAVDYLNCADTRLNRAIMRKTMIAACRRVRLPGVKFDNITVLESPEGWNKSGAWRTLAGDKDFSDMSILGQRGREVQEQLSEIWIHESADLAGMRKAEVESDVRPGRTALSEAKLALIRHSAALALELEQMEGRLSQGDEINLDSYGRAASHLRRLLETLGVERKPNDVTPSLEQYTHQRRFEAAG